MRKELLIILLGVLAISALVAQGSYWGTKGLLRTVSADNQGKGYLTISAYANYFQNDLHNQIVQGDLMHYTQRHSEGFLFAAFAPIKYLEISGGITGLVVSDAGVYPEEPTQFGFGDTYTGLKGSWDPFWWTTIGGYGYVTWPTGSANLKDSVFVNQEATFAGIGLLTFDFTDERAELPLPLRLHFNFGYLEGHSITNVFSEDYDENDPEQDDLYLVRAGLEIPAGRFAIFADFSTEQSTRPELDFTDNPIRITPGVRFMNDWIVGNLGVEIGLGDVGVEDVRNVEPMEWKLVSGVSFLTRLSKDIPEPIYAEVTGTITDAEKGIPLIATVTSDDTAMFEPYVTTGNGVYEIKMSQGAHNVFFSASGYETVSKSLVIKDSSGIAMDIQLKPLVNFGVLTGKISNMETGEPVQGTIEFEGEELWPVQIDQNGVYKTELPVGSYTMIVDIPNYRISTEVVVIRKNETTQKDIALNPVVLETDGIIRGTVTDINTGEGLVANIAITEGDFSAGKSNIDGSYDVTLPGGTYTLKFRREGYLPATKTVVVKVGETSVLPVEMKPLPMGVITGKVTDTRKGEPLQATISLPGTELEPIMANEEGIYKVQIAPGTYEIKAEYPEYISQSFPLVVEEGKTTMRNFELVKPGEKITLRGIYFEFDKARIQPESKPTLDRAIKILDDNPSIDVMIEGHTDWIGSESYNQQLSQRRADAVKAYLVREGGIDAGRITTIGKGENDPIASNETDEGRSLNRRIEFVILDGE